jgi:hypothetical protein
MSGKAIRRHFVKALAVCGLALAALGMTQSASAQFGAMGGSDDVFRPEYTTRDVVLFVEGLDLDEQQRYIFETLFEMYQADFELGVEEVRDKLANMRHELVGGDPREMLEKVFAPVDEWRKKKDVLGTRLMLDLKAQLSPQQQDMWPSFDRKLRRIKTLKDGVLTGENIDIFFVISQLDMTKQEKDAIQPILERYEVELDAALQARNDYISSSQDELSTAIRGQETDRAKDLVEKQVNYRLTVRNTTETALQELMAALPEETAAKLRRNSLEQAYGQVFRPTQMERIFEQVLEMEDLSAETVTAVNDLENRYNTELATVNERLVQLIRDQDGVKAIERVERLVHRVGGQTVAVREDPVRDEFRNRDELDKKYLRELRALLTPAQFSALPGSSKLDGVMRGGGDPAAFRQQRTTEPSRFQSTPRRADGTYTASDRNLGNTPPEDDSGKKEGEDGKGGGRGGSGDAPAGDGGSGGDGSGGSGGSGAGGRSGSGGSTPRGGRGA